MIASSRPTEALRAEHRGLLPHIDRLREAADRVGAVPPEALRREVAEAYEFLVDHLAPHAAAEDEVLYPAVGRILGSSRSTATMSRDHVAILALADELGRLRSAPEERPQDVRRVLYGLHALVSTHFAKEEEVYLALLDERISPEEFERLYAKMEAAARAAMAQRIARP